MKEWGLEQEMVAEWGKQKLKYKRLICIIQINSIQTPTPPPLFFSFSAFFSSSLLSNAQTPDLQHEDPSYLNVIERDQTRWVLRGVKWGNGDCEFHGDRWLDWATGRC